MSRSTSGFRTEITIDQVERSVEIGVGDEEPEFLKHLPAGRKFRGIAGFRCALILCLNKGPCLRLEIYHD